MTADLVDPELRPSSPQNIKAGSLGISSQDSNAPPLLDTIAISPPHQGQGIGKRLIHLETLLSRLERECALHQCQDDRKSGGLSKVGIC